MENEFKTAKQWETDTTFMGMRILEVKGPIATLWDRQPLSKEDFKQVIQEYCKVEWSLSKL